MTRGMNGFPSSSMRWRVLQMNGIFNPESAVGIDARLVLVSSGWAALLVKS